MVLIISIVLVSSIVHGYNTNITLGTAADSGKSVGYATNADEYHFQSFNSTGLTIYNITIYLRKVASPTDNITIRLETENGATDEPSGSLISAGATASMVSSGIAASFTAYNFVLNSPTDTTNLSRYYLVVKRSGAYDTTNIVVVAHDTSDEYAFGHRSEYDGSWVDAQGEDITGTIYGELNDTPVLLPTVYFDINPFNDTYTDKFNPNTNYATSSYIYVEFQKNGSPTNESYTKYSFLGFNLSEYLPPDANISSCELYLKYDPTVHRSTMSLYLINNSFDYSNVTFNNMPATTTYIDLLEDTEADNWIKFEDGTYCALYKNSTLHYRVNKFSEGLASPNNYTTKFYSMDYSNSNYYPYLSVAYTTTNGTDLTVYAYNLSETPISNFNVTISIGNYTETFNTTTGVLTISDLTHGYYNISILSTDLITQTSTVYLINSTQTLNYTMNKLGQATLTFYDETINQILNNTNITINIISSSTSQNYSTSTGSLSLVLDAGFNEIRYWSDNHYINTYYLNIDESSATSLRLYLINKSESNLITMTIEDVYGDSLENAYITVYKKFIPENTYRIVRMDKTGYAGQTGLLYLNKYDSWYKFLVEYPFGTQRKLTNEYIITDNELSITVNILGDILESYRIIDNVAINLSFISTDNTTGYFRLSYIDTNNIVDESCLKVKKSGSISEITVCNTCISGTSGEIFCGINKTGLYFASAIIESNTNFSTYVLDVISVDFDEKFNIYGSTGMFLAFIIILALIMFGFFHPQVAIVMGIFGLLMVYFTGLFYGSLTTIVGIVILGGIILYSQQER